MPSTRRFLPDTLSDGETRNRMYEVQSALRAIGLQRFLPEPRCTPVTHFRYDTITEDLKLNKL